MTYELIHKETGRVLVEAKRINDLVLIDQVRGCFDCGCFADGSVALLKNDVEIDPAVVTDKDNARMDSAVERKEQTHKKVWVVDGVSGFKRKPVWVKR